MDFSGFDEIIRFAVQREEEAARSYGEMIILAGSEGARKLLLELQEEEKKHKDVLLGLSRGKLEGPAGGGVQDLKISDYLVDEPLGRDMSFQDLLIFAAKKEKKAVDLYTSLAGKAGTEDRKRLFRFLAKQELIHKLRLELEYEATVLPED